MKYKISLAIVVIAMFSACTSSHKKTVDAKTGKRMLASAQTITAKLKPVDNTKDGNTFIVDSAAAVITILDTTEIEKRHKASNDDEFYTVADDQMFYIAEARTFLKKQSVKIIELPPGYKYLVFKLDNGKTGKIKLDTVTFISNLYFFDPHKKPYNVDVLDVEGEFKKYFNK